MTVKECPFCKGKLHYTAMRKEVRQPELIQCMGDCNLEMMNEDYKDPMKLVKYMVPVDTKKFLIFCGQEFYANGGANDLISTEPRTKGEAVKYARKLMSKRFSTNHWFDGEEYDISIPVQWVQVFDLTLCTVVYETGNVHGDKSGVVIL